MESIFTSIEKLNFPPEQFMIVGSGVMDAKGIRKSNDLDILVSQDLFEKCESEGWDVKPWTWKGDPNQHWLKKGDIELMLEMRYEGENVSLEQMKNGAEQVNGIWFLSLDQLLNVKRRSGRESDLKDIEMVEKYIYEQGPQQTL